jgi:hypothetical protein
MRAAQIFKPRRWYRVTAAYDYGDSTRSAQGKGGGQGPGWKQLDPQE